VYAIVGVKGLAWSSALFWRPAKRERAGILELVSLRDRGSKFVKLFRLQSGTEVGKGSVQARDTVSKTELVNDEAISRRFPLVDFHYSLEYTRFWPIWSRKSAVYAVGLSNDHELEIAREIDKVSIRDYLGPDVVPEILAFLDFNVSSTDYEFLKRYLEWRMENPIVK
jgi:hypothetical protein